MQICPCWRRFTFLASSVCMNTPVESYILFIWKECVWTGGGSVQSFYEEHARVGWHSSPVFSRVYIREDRPVLQTASLPQAQGGKMVLLCAPNYVPFPRKCCWAFTYTYKRHSNRFSLCVLGSFRAIIYAFISVREEEMRTLLRPIHGRYPVGRVFEYHLY
jgi:hypothetical protein